MDLSPFLTSGAPYLVAFAAGLFGSAHCAAMCGPVGAALHLGARRGGETALHGLRRQLLFNAGRILTYMLAGAAAGLAGATAADQLSQWQAWTGLRLVAALVMIATGLYLAGIWNGVLRIEAAGARLLRPVTARLRGPARTDRPLGVVLLGTLWGGIPCGLVYTALIWSLAAGSALDGAAFMLAFGAGTLPAVVGAAWAAGRFPQVLNRAGVRRAAGCVVAAAGVWVALFSVLTRPATGLGCLLP
ncbi:MAG: sulfite exporter TauE/SafE family protein [Gammaproteobacteria bacterium]|nr:sulfite exporter TauE/SafE family protein [Gammaproteobacteria bacterium]